MSMILESNLSDHDRIYQSLIDLHAGKTAAESDRINAKLILLLANQLGDTSLVLEAIALAAAPPGATPA